MSKDPGYVADSSVSPVRQKGKDVENGSTHRSQTHKLHGIKDIRARVPTMLGQKQINLNNSKYHMSETTKPKTKRELILEQLGPNFSKPEHVWGEQVHEQPIYIGKVDKAELPDHALNEHDFQKRLRFEELKNVKLEEMCNWKQKDKKGIKKSSYIKEIQRKNEGILTVAQKDSLEKLEVYRDRFPLLGLRKTLNKIRIIIHLDAHAIQNSKIFENATIIVIVINSFTMMLQDPTKDPTPFDNTLENIFLALYSLEMIIKIMGLGFVLNQGSYLREPWNILDFVIVISSYPTLFESNDQPTTDSAFSLSGLRAFRVMRPLKTISSVKGLKVLVQALAQAMPILGNTIVILLFFFAIFAIAGTNLMSGNLMKRCMGIQTGKMHPTDEPLCGGVECPGGYFCGRTNENPNFGVTNFDNVMYSLLCVFQSVTLEGWSDIQKQMQKAYTYSIFFYFLPLVFIGAFFLLNLTMAVINSEFTKAHKDHVNSEQAKHISKKHISIDNDLETLNSKDEWSISQFITARIYAKKMIAFLRARQQAKKFELDKIQSIKQKQNAVAQAKRKITDNQGNQSRALGISANKKSTDIIMEDAAEHHDEVSDQEQLEKEIQDFIKNSKIHMQRHFGKQYIKSNNFAKRESEGGMPTMKGNIGPTSKFLIDSNQDQASKQKTLFMKMAEDFAIEKIIPNPHQTKSNEDIGYSNGSFNLSLNDDDIQSKLQNSSDRNQSVQNKVNADFEVPGLHNRSESSDLITSDSGFDMPGATTLGHPTAGEFATPVKQKAKDPKKDISKAFKKLLTKNNQRQQHATTTIGMSKENKSVDESTKFDNSDRLENYHEEGNSQIEKKFAKKKGRKGLQHKLFLDEEFIFENRNPEKVDPTQFGKEDKKNININEYINTKRPNDPFKGINPLAEKVAIQKNLQYQGTSQNDVFYLRYMQQNEQQPLDDNKFLTLPEEKLIPEDPDFVDNSCLKPAFEPYQGKVIYAINEEESDNELSDEQNNEDALFNQEQPYDTTASLAYKEMLKQLPTGELAKRSDIMITSTLSLSMFPKDKRIIMIKKRAHMNNKMIREYIDEKNAFNALVKEHMYATPTIKEKEKEYSDVYMKSFIHRSNFTTATLQKFKQQVKILNSNKPIPKRIDENVKTLERLKHQQNINRVSKKGIPKFDRDLAMKLLEGKLHDPDDDDDENLKPLSLADKKSVYAKNKDELQKIHAIENFSKRAKDILHDYEHQRIKQPDEIPPEVKKTFDLPEKMGIYQLDFKRVKNNDFTFKRQRPVWSGQDVLVHKINISKAEYIISHINGIRTWPNGLHGIWKRIRFQLRRLVRSPFFDSFMTFAVFLNTITLSIDNPEIQKETTEILDTFNVYFTWIFIFEMFSKIAAIGVPKYCNERMNYLDGSVVLLSIFEMIMDAVLSGNSGMSLDAFKTVRMLRTFRVFRIARLLRAMQSMQTIVGVMVRSYKSFIYITMLMFLFIIIFALLGMQVFGGTMNYEDGTPRGNYDEFEIAFITTFQVLTMENWQQVLFDSMRSEMQQPYVVSIYYITWIFLGNFILLNLFLAILLDSFLEEEEDLEDEEEMMAEKHRQMQKRALKRKKMDVNKLFMDLQSQKLIDAENNDPAKYYFGEQKAPSEGEDLEDLDEEQILQIYKEDGLIQKTSEELKLIKDFIGIESESSIFIFSKENAFRKLCYHIKIAWFFEPIVQVLIALSSFKLGFDTYIETGVSEIFDQVSNTIDFSFNLLFIVEMVIKIVAEGLVMDKGSYLRDSWNRLDFFIVMSSIIDMSMTGLEIPIIKLLRMLRVLRPLRFINHNRDLKMVVVALLDSMSHIINVIIVIAVVYLIFAIVGVSLFGGKFFYCNIDMYTIQTEQECLLQLGQWMRYDFNFDNVKEAMLTLYVIANLEAWPDLMYQTLDMTDLNVGPTKEKSMWTMWFFVLFILIGSFFFLNFFIGVLFLKFNQAQREEQKGFSKEDLVWQDIQKMIVTAKPDYESTNVPDQAWRLWFHELVISWKFQLVITISIMLNMIQMAMLHEDQSKSFSWFIEFTNYIFTIIFIVEAILKLIAFGKSYFKNSWNKFDFFVVVASIFDVLLKFLEKVISGGFLTVAPQLARIMRVLRVTRVVRLANKAQGLQQILQTVSFSIGPLSNVIILLMLIFLMFSILGNFLFKNIKYGEFMDEIVNFQRFDNAFLLLFSLSTGENWPWIMFDCSRTEKDGCIMGETCGNAPWSYFYFMVMVLVCQYVMLNLFILVIIQQFEKYYLQDDNMLKKFSTDKDVFMGVWKQFTQKKFRCQRIKEKQLPAFFRELGEIGNEETTLGFNKDHVDDGDLNKQLLKMGIKSDMGCIYFNELLYRVMRRRYGNMKINKKMQIFELRTQYKIYLLTLKEKNMSQKRINNDDIYKNVVKKENGVNPFLTVMNFKITFKTWLKFAKQRLREEAKARGEYNNDEDSSIDQENRKPHSVMIEIEKYMSFTSEEDSDEIGGKSVNSFKPGTNSKWGSNNQGLAAKRRKTKNHLTIFEKKMTQRFQQITAEQQIRQVTGKEKQTGNFIDNLTAEQKQAASNKLKSMMMQNMKKKQ